MQRPGDRGGGKGQHVHVRLDLFDLFLMGHAEALFLVYDQKPQILEFHVLGKEPVGSDQNVHLAFLQLI